MSGAATTAAGPRLWVAGDWNAFFGFGTNILVNLLVTDSAPCCGSCSACRMTSSSNTSSPPRD